MELNLSSIASHLKQSGFEIHLEPPSDAVPFEQLFVSIGSDDQKNERTLQIRLFSQSIPQGYFEKKSLEPQYLDFFIALPYEVSETMFGDTARLTSLINKILPLPGFTLSEIDKRLYYRYLYPTCNQTLSSQDLEIILLTLIYQIETYSSSFEEVAQGKKSYTQVVADAETFSKSLS